MVGIKIDRVRRHEAVVKKAELSRNFLPVLKGHLIFTVMEFKFFSQQMYCNAKLEYGGPLTPTPVSFFECP